MENEDEAVEPSMPQLDDQGEILEEEPDQDLADAQSATQDYDAPRRKARRRVMVGAAFAVAVVIALVLVGFSGPGSSDASAQVLTAAETTLAQHTVALTLSGSVTANGRIIPISGSGFADLSSNLETLTTDVSANGQTVQETVLENGTSAFMKIVENDQDLVSQLLPGKDWVQVATGASTTSGLGASSPNILAQLQLLAAKGNSVVSLGSSSIDGVPVTGYRVTITEKSLTAAYQRLEANNGAEASVIKSMLKSISLSPPVIQVWLGSDHLLRRESVALNVTTNGVTASGDVNVDFTHYGLPVTVSIPASNDVASYGQFLAAAKAAG